MKWFCWLSVGTLEEGIVGDERGLERRVAEPRKSTAWACRAAVKFQESCLSFSSNSAMRQSRYAICQLYSTAHVITHHSVWLSPRCVRNTQCGQWAKEQTKERLDSTSQLISQLLHYCCCQTKHNSSLALSHTHTTLQMCMCVLVCLCSNNCVGCLLPVFVVYLCCNFILKHKGGHSWLGLMWISQRLDDESIMWCNSLTRRLTA